MDKLNCKLCLLTFCLVFVSDIYCDVDKRQQLEKCSIKCEPIGPPPEPSSEAPPPPGGSPGGIVNIFLSPNGAQPSPCNPLEPTFQEPENLCCGQAHKPICAAPAPQPMCPSLAPKPVCATPAPQPICAYPAPKPICPAPQPICVTPAPKPVCVAPAPQPICATPAPKPICVSPEPQPICVAPPPTPVCVAPAPKPVCATPISEPICTVQTPQPVCSSNVQPVYAAPFQLQSQQEPVDSSDEKSVYNIHLHGLNQIKEVSKSKPEMIAAPQQQAKPFVFFFKHPGLGGSRQASEQKPCQQLQTQNFANDVDYFVSQILQSHNNFQNQMNQNVGSFSNGGSSNCFY
ncbi:hypothetical protein GJ496_010917 [Pomphorhynchus laevis]|nr:hypothetical protein GJ496_010917 [Pomphorhynchus laevis]